MEKNTLKFVTKRPLNLFLETLVSSPRSSLADFHWDIPLTNQSLSVFNYKEMTISRSHGSHIIQKNNICKSVLEIGNCCIQARKHSEYTCSLLSGQLVQWEVDGW